MLLLVNEIPRIVMLVSKMPNKISIQQQCKEMTLRTM